MSQAACRREQPDKALWERAAIRSARGPIPSRIPDPRRVSQLLSGLLAMLADLTAEAKYPVSWFGVSPALNSTVSSRYKVSVGKSTDWGLGVVVGLGSEIRAFELGYY